MINISWRWRDHAKADGLLTKDRDLLRLRKRAARFGVTVASPKDFLERL
jgi:predicted nucleic acid-binding protein